MYQRPVSPGTSVAKKGTVLKVWGKSNVAGGATIVMSTNGSTWKTAPGQRRAADRSVTATVKVTRKTYFAVKDVAGRGPSRLVAVRSRRWGPRLPDAAASPRPNAHETRCDLWAPPCERRRTKVAWRRAFLSLPCSAAPDSPDPRSILT
jgi:hypothetical protein